MLFRYSLRSLWAHKTDTVFSLVGIAGVTWACLTCLAFVFRFNDAMHAAGKHDNVIVLQQSARRETFSWIDKQIYDQLRAFPGIKSEEGRDLVSAEYVGHVVMRSETVGEILMPIRGVEPIAYAVHPQVEVREGRKPTDGESELMIGQQAAHMFKLGLGSKIPLGEKPWEVVGVFAAGGSGLERELWTSQSNAARAFKRPGKISSVTLTLASANGADELNRYMETRRKVFPDLAAYAEPEHRASEENALRAAVRVVSAIVFAVGLGAVFGATNSLQAATKRDLPQLTTLVVLGMRRKRVASMIMAQGIVLGVLAGLAGALLVAPLGAAFNLPDLFVSSIEVDLSMNLQTIVMGLGLGLAIGIAGGFYPAITLMRASLVEGVR